MLVFQGLEFESKDPKAAINHIDSLVGDVWERNKEAEVTLKSAGSSQVAFRYIGRKLPRASLFLIQSGSSYSVTNVIPEEKSLLEKSEYNGLLTDFYARISDSKDISASISGPNMGVEDFFAEEAAQALRRFSGAANMSTGRAHPSDEERWIEFLYSAATDNKEVDAGVVGSLLLELGWGENQADNLSTDYEYGISIIKYTLARAE